MESSIRRAAAAFAAVTGFAFGAGAFAAAGGGDENDPQIRGLENPSMALVIKDEKNKLGCYESQTGLSCTALRDGAMTGGLAIEPIQYNGAVVMHKMTDIGGHNVCYGNSGGMWCGSPAARPAASQTEKAGYQIDLIQMGDAGPTLRILDRDTNMAVYSNKNSTSGAVMALPEGSGRDNGLAVTRFGSTARRIPMERIRDYDSGVTCYYTPEARYNFACASLAEDKTSDTDQRAILFLNDPDLHYSVIDNGSNGVVINVNDIGVCTANWQYAKADPKLDIKEIDLPDGRKATRLVDVWLGVIGYTTEKGFSCGNLAPPPAAPSPQ